MIPEEFNFQVARTIFWGQRGAESIGFVAKSTTDFIVTAFDAELVPVSAHFAKIQQMIFNVGDHVAIIKLRSDGSIGRLAILEHTTLLDGEFLYLHFVDPWTLSVSPMTRVSVDDIVSVSPGKHLRCEL